MLALRRRAAPRHSSLACAQLQNQVDSLWQRPPGEAKWDPVELGDVDTEAMQHAANLHTKIKTRAVKAVLIFPPPHPNLN